jgi:thiol-disulfide isomerase/thioredoxin
VALTVGHAVAQSAEAKRSVAEFYRLDSDTTLLDRDAAAHPEDVDLRHWDLALGTLDKDHLKLSEKFPGGAWGALVRARYASPWERKTLLDAAIQASPGDGDILVLATRQMQSLPGLSTDSEQKEAFRADLKAFLDEHAKAYEGSAHGLAALAEARRLLDKSVSGSKGAGHAEVAAIADRALKLDAKEPQALLVKSALLVAEGKKNENYDLVNGFVAAGTDSFAVFQADATAISTAPKLSADQKKQALAAMTKRLLDLREPTRYQVITLLFESQSAGAEVLAGMEDSIVKRYPNSVASDTALYMQATMDDPAVAIDPNAPEKIDALQGYLDLPHHPEPLTVAQARAKLVHILSKQPQPDLERLFKQVTLADAGDQLPDTDAIAVLVDAKSHLAEIEALAEKHLDAEPYFVGDNMLRQSDKQGFYDFAAASFFSPWQSLLGDVYLREGKLDAAEEKVKAALETSPANLVTTIRLGRIEDAKGQHEQAKKTFEAALALVYVGADEHPAVAALRDNYLLQHPGGAGLDAYMADIRHQDSERRRKAVLAARNAKPEAIPAFTLKTLDGRTVTAEDLKGKVVVLNFWATWCGPCRAELPDFEKLAKQYRDDPKVMVLSMSVDSIDTPVATIANFVKKHDYDFPVLLGPGFGVDNHIAPIPMTWFIDPAGREAYRKIGYTKELVEEFSWRIESLLPAGSGTKAGR